MNKYQEAIAIRNAYIQTESGTKCLDDYYKESFDILQELVDKATPKKPNFLNYGGYKLGNWHCPNCDSIIILDSRKPKPPKRCEECDQLLDWGDTNE